MNKFTKLLILTAIIAAAQTMRTIADGVYTQEQANRGKSAYTARCAACHGADLTGGDETPALSGPKFLAKWQNRPLADLFENMQATMPADKPEAWAAR